MSGNLPLVLLNRCRRPQAHVPWRHRVVYVAAPWVEHVRVGLAAGAFRVQRQPIGRARDAEAFAREVEPMGLADTQAAGVTGERQVLAACLAEIDFAARMRATGSLDVRAAIFVTVQMVEGGLAGFAGFGRGGILHLGTSVPEINIAIPAQACQEK